MERGIRLLILFFFFVSGACGLVYEITWLRLLSLQLGNTLSAITAVLTAFMGGLALGSFLWGKYIDGRPKDGSGFSVHGSRFKNQEPETRNPKPSRDPLSVYGGLEILIGLYGLLLPFLIAHLEPFFRWTYPDSEGSFFAFHLTRFVLCILLLLIPTTLMGGTFPVLCRYFVKSQDRLGWDLGRLYGLNLWGGVLGAACAGFFLLPGFGVTLTHRTAALTNLALGAAALIVRRQTSGVGRQGTGNREQGIEGRDQRGEGKGQGPGSHFRPSWIPIAAGLSGLAAMIYQVGWTRVLNLSIGSSVYAFSLVLVAFLGGLALGSLLLSRLIDRVRDPILLLGLAEGLLALAAWVAIPLLGRLPLWVIPGILSRFGHFKSILFWELSLVALVLLVPTTLLGFLFPLIGKLYVRDLPSLGESVGIVYAANTVGAILGILAGGFLLVPWLGLQRTLVIGVAVNLGLGILFLLSSTISRPLKGVAVLGVSLLVLLLSLTLPSWDKGVLTSGPFLYAEEYLGRPDLEGAIKERADEVLYYREGSVGTVSVHRLMDGVLTLKIDGKTDASTGPDMKTQVLLAHLPLLLHPSPQRALVIGLGSGITLGAVTRSPLNSIECLEVSPEVVEAASYFKEHNHNALADPRLRLIIEDARTFLSLSEDRYDVISSEPSNLWVKGVANLFTQEFFRLCRRRLNPGGILCQWLHYYKTPSEDFKSLINTFGSVFPHAQLWEAIGAGDYLLIGSDRPISLTLALLSRRLTGGARQDLDGTGIHTMTDLLSHFFMEGVALKQYAQDAPINTDDNALLEFSSPRGLYQTPQPSPLEELIRFREPATALLPSWENIDLREGLVRGFSAKKLFLQAKVDFLRGERQRALLKLENSLSIDPRDLEVRFLLGRTYLALSQAALAGKGLSEATTSLEKFLAIYPENIPIRLELAALYQRREKGEKALEQYKKALEQEPQRGDICLKVAALLDERGLLVEAESYFRRAIELDSASAMPHLGLGLFYLERGRPEEAHVELERALERDPSNVHARRMLREMRE